LIFPPQFCLPLKHEKTLEKVTRESFVEVRGKETCSVGGGMSEKKICRKISSNG